jgi:hypothetical protein
MASYGITTNHWTAATACATLEPNTGSCTKLGNNTLLCTAPHAVRMTVNSAINTLKQILGALGHVTSINLYAQMCL